MRVEGAAYDSGTGIMNISPLTKECQMKKEMRYQNFVSTNFHPNMPAEIPGVALERDQPTTALEINYMIYLKCH